MDDAADLQKQILELRARVTITERAAWLGAEVAALTRPEQSCDFLEKEREKLKLSYRTGTGELGHFSVEERTTIWLDIDRKFDQLIQAVKRTGGIA